MSDKHRVWCCRGALLIHREWVVIHQSSTQQSVLTSSKWWIICPDTWPALAVIFSPLMFLIKSTVRNCSNFTSKVVQCEYFMILISLVVCYCVQHFQFNRLLRFSRDTFRDTWHKARAPAPPPAQPTDKSK